MSQRPYSATEKAACIERELRMRRTVYPRWVASGKITRAFADNEVRIMEAIRDDYARMAEGERLL